MKSICGRASWLRVCPMPVITLCVNIPAPCSTLNYPLVPSVYRTSICIRSFRAGRRNTIGIRPGTGGDSNLLETYRAIPPPPLPSPVYPSQFVSKVLQTEFSPLSLPLYRFYRYIYISLNDRVLQFLGSLFVQSTSYYSVFLLFSMKGK